MCALALSALTRDQPSNTSHAFRAAKKNERDPGRYVRGCCEHVCLDGGAGCPTFGSKIH